MQSVSNIIMMPPAMNTRTKPSEDTFAQRLEQKYVIDRVLLETLMVGNAKPFFDLFKGSYLQDDCKYNRINNIYFDTADLAAYHGSIERQEERMKLRVRQYSPNGTPEEFVYFEQKDKKDGYTFKRRIQLHESWVAEFLKTGHLPMIDFLRLNEDKREALELYSDLQGYIFDQGYKPVLRTSYSRKAFSLFETKKVRMTIDTQLEFSRLMALPSLRLPYVGAYLQDCAIIEMKIASPRHLSIFNNLSSVSGQPKSFSKYCYGVYSTR